MNEGFEDLAKAIFEHEHSDPNCPVADWEHQSIEHQDRYRTAAMAARLIVMGPIYNMEVIKASLAVPPEGVAS